MVFHKLIPDSFVRTTIELYGSEGAAWLQNLPALLDEFALRWSLTIEAPFAPLSYNYVAPARRADGSEVVLKAGFPNNELHSELEALRHYAGHGIVQLLEADRMRGVMLLERLHPGLPLARLDDDEAATSIAAQVMRQLWRPAPAGHNFRTVTDWAQGMAELREEFDGGCGPFPPHLVDAAETLFHDLLSSCEEPVLLHGDLHHYNILSAQRRSWLALDPKGVVGEAAYEVGALLRNPASHIASLPDLDRICRNRLDQLSGELEMDRERLKGWGIAQAVLSAWWCYEDHGRGWETTIACAQCLSKA